MKKYTRIPQQNRGKETKQKIIEAGLQLFSEKGFYKTNSKEIAKAAKVSTGSFYAYFADKRELFLSIVKDYHHKIKDVIQNIDPDAFVQSKKEKEFIRMLIDKLIEAHSIYPEFHQELITMSQSDQEIVKLNEISSRESIEISKIMLNKWRGNLRVNDIEATAVIVQKSIEEIIHTIIFSKIEVNDERLINELTDMLYRYLFKN